MFTTTTLFVLLFSTAYAFYERSDVIELTDSDFSKSVLKGDEIWIVEFYAPWCGHCKKFFFFLYAFIYFLLH